MSVTPITPEDKELILALNAEREALLRQARELTIDKIAEKFEYKPFQVWNLVRSQSNPIP